MIIRPAVLDDSAAVLALRNTPEAVFWSGKPRISEESHREWFHENLPVILVLADAEGVWGYVRISDRGRVSFVVDSHVRGRGYGRQLLLAIEPLARTCSLHRLWAEVHPGNVASMLAFMHAGYHLTPDWTELGRYEQVTKDL